MDGEVVVDVTLKRHDLLVLAGCEPSGMKEQVVLQWRQCQITSKLAIQIVLVLFGLFHRSAWLLREMFQLRSNGKPMWSCVVGHSSEC